MLQTASDNHEITYEDYLALPETMQRYELLDGEMIMSPAPTTRHQIVWGNCYRALHAFVSRQRLGIVLFAPLDVIVQRKPRLRTRQPDLIYVSSERRQVLGDQIEAGPDLVVDILSASETRRQITAKLRDYRKIGVKECWLLSLEAETVEVLRITTRKTQRAGLYGIGDTLRSGLFPTLRLPTKKFFD